MATTPQSQDRSYLLMETQDGQPRRVENADFAEQLEHQARALRMVFLSACQSAVSPSTEGFNDLGTELQQRDIPTVVAMQYSVLNRSAMDFGSVFYKSIAVGKSLDTAMSEGRSHLAQEGLNNVDFATQVLFLADPDCLRVAPAALRERDTETPLDLSGMIPAQHFVGRSAELQLRECASGGAGGQPESGRLSKANMLHSATNMVESRVEKSHRR